MKTSAIAEFGFENLVTEPDRRDQPAQRLAQTFSKKA